MLIIYHAKCYDGFTSAWICSKRFDIGGREVRYHAGHYHKLPPKVLPNEIVYIVDFSYPPEQIDKIAEVADKVYIYDHHKSAAQKFAGYKRHNVHIVIDMERSGAQITWDELWKREKRPKLVDYVADRDLWNWELYESEAINKFIRTYPCKIHPDVKFHHFDVLSWNLENQFYRAIDIGHVLLEEQNKQVAGAKDNVRILQWDNQPVGVVNTTVYMSEIGNWVSDKMAVSYAACWHQRNDGHYSWSLRSQGFDVSEVAKLYGGGGHQKAAGFNVEVEDVQRKLLTGY